jgi:hypothetical protein
MRGNLAKMYAFSIGGIGVLEIKDMHDVGDDMEVGTDNATSGVSVKPPKLGGSVTWNNPVVTVPTASGVMRSG